MEELVWGQNLDRVAHVDVVVACGAHLRLLRLNDRDVALFDRLARARAYTSALMLYYSQSALYALNTRNRYLTPFHTRDTRVHACADVMYILEAIPDLVATLDCLCGPKTIVYVAHGRNCGAEEAFLERLAGWRVQRVPASQQHPSYHAPDVTVFKCSRPRRKKVRCSPEPDNSIPVRSVITARASVYFAFWCVALAPRGVAPLSAGLMVWHRHAAGCP